MWLSAAFLAAAFAASQLFLGWWFYPALAAPAYLLAGAAAILAGAAFWKTPDAPRSLVRRHGPSLCRVSFLAAGGEP